MFGKEIALFSKSVHRKEGESVRKNVKTADTGQRNAKRVFLPSNLTKNRGYLTALGGGWH